jgi:hypothetical protein
MSSQDRDPPPQGAGKSLGGGAEAAEGLHGLQQSDGGAAPDARDGAGSERPTTQRTGGSDVRTEGTSAADQSGSEPLPRTREHAPSYGGAGGDPRTSSDQREPADARGDQGGRPANPS